MEKFLAEISRCKKKAKSIFKGMLLPQESFDIKLNKITANAVAVVAGGHFGLP